MAYKKHSFKNRVLISAALATFGLGLSGCMLSSTYVRHEQAVRIASPVWMKQRIIPAAPFALTAFERIHERGKEVNIYIEGDGLAWVSKRRWSLDPTPQNPFALRLAAKDAAENVIYLARPCQYSKLLDPAAGPCDYAYWTNKRTAPEVLQAYQTALDDIAARYGFHKIHLIGYSGGGTVAALLAATRSDIASLRTVAGNLDHKTHSRLHNVSLTPESLNPPDYAESLKAVPQHHFVGGRDDIVPLPVYESFARAAGPSPCIRQTILPGATHDKGWLENWPALLKEPVSCAR